MQKLIEGLIYQCAQRMPLAMLKRLHKPRFGRAGRKLVRLGLANRDVILPTGSGKGLRFNAANANPSAALGAYELPVQQAIAQHLKPGDVFYDIGANVGFFTVLGAQLVGNEGAVYAFEPDQNNAQAIRHNVTLNGFSQVDVVQKAVSQTDGSGTLLLTDYAGGHTLSSVERPPQVRAEISVDLVSIDTLISQGDLKPPALVKIDVEGAEIEVLKGMQQTLERDRPTLIYEADDRHPAHLKIKQNELNSYVQQFGYELLSLADSYGDIGWNVGHTVAVAQEKAAR